MGNYSWQRRGVLIGIDHPPLPLPPGLSGSLIWNTRVVEQRIRGQSWSPADARVTGIVWGWPSGTCLVATKVEHMRLDELVAAVAQHSRV